MDLQRIFSEAVRLHSQGKLKPAKKKYELIMEVLPDNINVLGNMGLVCRELGKFEEALKYCRKAVHMRPDDPDQWINLGAVYEASGDFGAARDMYEKALGLSPNHPKALNNLGKVLHLQGDVIQALGCFEKAVAVMPDYPLALNNIAVIISERGDVKGAVPYLEKSYYLEPANAGTGYNLAGLYNILGEEEKAVAVLERVLKIDPDHAPARHMAAALRGEATESAPEEYVRDTFDRYANRFDNHLQGVLGYRVPVELAQMAQKHEPGRIFGNCMDLGCGTGLSGDAFRSVCSVMAGIDLSERMLDKARGKALYDNLVCSEIMHFLRRSSDKVDLFIAADVFIYLGNLGPFFKELQRLANRQAIVACSIEHHPVPGEYTLRPSGRYAHSPSYLEDTALNCGFSVKASAEHDIRKEHKEVIPGHLYLFQFNQG